MSELPVRDRVQAIQKLAEKATPGPWVPKNCADDGDKQPWWWVWQESKLPHYGGVLEIDRQPDGTPDFNGGNIGPAGITDNQDGEQEGYDAAFIAAARTEVSWLASRLLEALDTIDKLTAKCEKQRDLIAALYGKAALNGGNE